VCGAITSAQPLGCRKDFHSSRQPSRVPGDTTGRRCLRDESRPEVPADWLAREDTWCLTFSLGPSEDLRAFHHARLIARRGNPFDDIESVRLVSRQERRRAKSVSSAVRSPCCSSPAEGSRRRAWTTHRSEGRRKLPDRRLSYCRQHWPEGSHAPRCRRAPGASPYSNGVAHDVKKRTAWMQPSSLWDGRIIGARYHDPSARDARRRVASFFNAQLKSLS
jgi:hypothetical protein